MTAATAARHTHRWNDVDAILTRRIDEHRRWPFELDGERFGPYAAEHDVIAAARKDGAEAGASVAKTTPAVNRRLTLARLVRRAGCATAQRRLMVVRPWWEHLEPRGYFPTSHINPNNVQQ